MKYSYRRGDKIVICSWEAMKKEFGLDDNGNINVPFKFPEEMRKFCGKEAIIRDVKISISHGIPVYRLEIDGQLSSLAFSLEMFHPLVEIFGKRGHQSLTPKKFKEFDESLI